MENLSLEEIAKVLELPLGTVFQAPDREQAEIYLKQIVTKYANSASDLTSWLEVSIPEGLTVFDFPSDHWRRIQTSNVLER